MNIVMKESPAMFSDQSPLYSVKGFCWDGWNLALNIKGWEVRMEL